MFLYNSYKQALKNTNMRRQNKLIRGQKKDEGRTEEGQGIDRIERTWDGQN